MSALTKAIAELNDQQRAAAIYRGSPMLIKALAGSGKTSVLTRRFARLVALERIDLMNIIMVTFTRKAADEMTRRIIDLLQAEGFFEGEEGKKVKPWVGTFHALGSRLLRDYAQHVGLDRNFTVLEEDENEYLFKEAMNQAGIKRGKQSQYEEGHMFRSPKEFASAYSYHDNRGEDPLEELPKQFETEAERDVAKNVISFYRQRKQDTNVLNFDDILIKWNELLDNPRISDEIRCKWEHVLVDEYQDTNVLQEGIISKLNTSELCVVGDVNQSIYRFRGSEPKNFIEFTKRYPTAKVFPLETNYRSTPQVLDAANEILESTGEDTRLQPVNANGARVNYASFRNDWAEAEFIVESIKAKLAAKVDPKDIAVLCRTSNGTNLIEQNLLKQNIPFEKRGGSKITDRTEIRDCLAMARILLNPLDRSAWTRTLQLHNGIGEKKALKAYDEWKEIYKQKLGETAAMDTAIDVMSKPGSEKLPYLSILHLLISKAIGAELKDLIVEIEKIWTKLAQEKYLHDNLKERTQNVITTLKQWQGDEHLEQLIERLALSKSEEEERLQEEMNKGKRRLVISTIHSAKGLEWPHVYVVGIGEKQLPSEMTHGDPDEEEEERRLLYVAMTRAEIELILTYPREFYNNYRREVVKQPKQTKFLTTRFQFR